jgi:hypothetical protein
MQLRLSRSETGASGQLLGVLMRGMTYDGERWRLATVGDWQPAGSHLPQPDQVQRLRQICHELFELFGGHTSEEPAA